ncbi:MAG: hypothetical protein ACREBC_38375, partial [Pyrinomonadaceae bacterium]
YGLCVFAGLGVGRFCTADISLAELGSYLAGTSGICATILGAAAVVVAFFAQRKQLQLTQHQLDTQIKQYEQQRVEETFFQLLQKYHDIATTIGLTRRDPNKGIVTMARGRDCFAVLYKRLQELVKAHGDNKETYALFFRDHDADLAHYFGHLQQTLSYLDKYAPDDAIRLAGFLGGQISTNEALLLRAFSTWKALDDKNFLDLLTKYNGFRSIP